MLRRVALLGIAVATIACGAPPSNPNAPRSSPKMDAEGCPADFALDALFAEHARASGSVERVASELPLTIHGAVIHVDTPNAPPGETTFVLSARGDRTDTRDQGRYYAWGVDGDQPWTHGPSGTTQMLRRGRESRRTRVEAWLMRRHYLRADEGAAFVKCRPHPQGMWVDVEYAREDLGNPSLTFDLDTSDVRALLFSSAQGQRLPILIRQAATDAHGVKWPVETQQGGEQTTWEHPEKGVICKNPPWRSDGATANGDACGARPPDRTTIEWPASGVVRVPLVYYGGELLVRVKIGDREAWAGLDSGANAAIVFAGGELARTFHSDGESIALGGTQQTKVQNGEIAEVTLGDLKIRHMTAIGGPVPALDLFGTRRPELMIGVVAFMGASVRVDYAKSEIVFTKTADLGTKSAVAASDPADTTIDLQLLDERVVAPFLISDKTGMIQVDTGSGDALDISAAWAGSHGLLRKPTYVGKGRWGVGDAETETYAFKVDFGMFAGASLDGVTAFTTPLDRHEVAGLLGNLVLARCDAVIIDVPARKLTTVGHCTRPPPRFALGFSVARNQGATADTEPWQVDLLMPDMPAERAGLQKGDHVLAIAGKPLSLDNALDLLDASKLDLSNGLVPVRISRDGKQSVVMLAVAPPR